MLKQVYDGAKWGNFAFKDKMRLPEEKAMKQILVIKHGALGDIIQAIDAFESLRLSFPDAHINLVDRTGGLLR